MIGYLVDEISTSPHPVVSVDGARDAAWEQGCLLQVTAGAVAGRFGEPARLIAHALLEYGLVTILAYMAIGAAGAANAGLMAAGILALQDPDLAARLDAWREALSASIPDEPKDE